MVKNMTKISKFLLFNPISILIKDIDCNFENIVKVINIFEFKHIVMRIIFLQKDSALMVFIKNKELKFITKQCSDNYVVLSVIVPYSLLNNVLKMAINEKADDICIFNLFDLTTWDIYQHNTSINYLVSKGVIDVALFVAFDARTLIINANKSLVRPKEMYEKVKEICFD